MKQIFAIFVLCICLNSRAETPTPETAASIAAMTTTQKHAALYAYIEHENNADYDTSYVDPKAMGAAWKARAMPYAKCVVTQADQDAYIVSAKIAAARYLGAAKGIRDYVHAMEDAVKNGK